MMEKQREVAQVFVVLENVNNWLQQEELWYEEVSDGETCNVSAGHVQSWRDG